MQKFPQEKNSCMLINEISKLFHDKMRETCEKLGFKNGYRQILMFLAHNDGATQVELVRVSHLKAPTISVTLKKMEDGFYRMTMVKRAGYKRPLNPPPAK